MANVYPGYRGLANIPGIGQVRFADASITARQEIRAEDLIMGDWDRDAYVYGPVTVEGTISGPVTETFVSGGGTGLFGWGITRSGTCGTLSDQQLTLYYYCGGTDSRARTFGTGQTGTGLLVNTLSFSCAAGDIATFSVDVMGKHAGSWLQTDPPHFTTEEKLITWDKVNVQINPGDEDFTPPANLAFSNFDFTVENNLEVAYALNSGSGGVGQPDLFPFEIVPGLRSLSGTLSVYNTPESNGVDKWDDYLAGNIGTITFDIGGLAVTAKVRFHRVEPASSVGPIISTIGYTGTGHQTGSPWEA